MKRYIPYRFLIIMLLLFTLTGCQSKQLLLTNNLENIQIVMLLYQDIETELPSDAIKQIYYSLTNIKAKVGSYDQTTDPKFILFFKYIDGSEDIIKTTENGEFFYKQLPDGKWIGGKNNKVLSIINDLSKQLD